MNNTEIIINQETAEYIEKLLHFYDQYHGRMGHFRPIVLNYESVINTDINDNEEYSLESLEPLFQRVIKKYGLMNTCTICQQNCAEMTCNRPECLVQNSCDQCRNKRKIEDLIFDSEGVSYCLFCKGQKEESVPPINDRISMSISQLNENSQFSLNTCTACDTEYLLTIATQSKPWTRPPNSDIPITSFCWKCRQAKILNECSKCKYCGSRSKPDDLSICDQGDCYVCVACSIKCEQCEKEGRPQQCRYTKKCTGPYPGHKVRVQGKYLCPICNIYKSMACNSYGDVLSRDECIHGWCHVCEIHNISHCCYSNT